MYQSRLLSWPAYFWYSTGGVVPSYGVPTCARYQLATMSRPSGFITGTVTKITSSRMRFISAVSEVATMCATSALTCAWPTSVAWSPKSIQTIALPSRASARACSSVSPRESESWRAMSLYRASLRRLSSDEIAARIISRPSVLLPIVNSLTRGDAAARALK